MGTQEITMRYNYHCKTCGTDQKPFVFETSHGMNEKPIVKCPKCSGVDTELTFIGVTPPIAYVRGRGYLDTKGRRRDMHLYKLTNDDPYAGMRQPGEKDDLAIKLRKGGKRNPNSKTFLPKS
jgi:predicted nucleic acid-binding Zn ribbon protein